MLCTEEDLAMEEVLKQRVN
jgi:hypothetical protein